MSFRAAEHFLLLLVSLYLAIQTLGKAAWRGRRAKTVQVPCNTFTQSVRNAFTIKWKHNIADLGMTFIEMFFVNLCILHIDQKTLQKINN